MFDVESKKSGYPGNSIWHVNRLLAWTFNGCNPGQHLMVFWPTLWWSTCHHKGCREN